MSRVTIKGDEFRFTRSKLEYADYEALRTSNLRSQGIKTIKNKRGTVVSTYRFIYKDRKGRERTSNDVEGQATTTRTETVANNLNKLLKNAYLDALVKFKEALGIPYSATLIPQHKNTVFYYYSDGVGDGTTLQKLTQRGNLIDKKIEIEDLQKAIPDAVEYKTRKQEKLERIEEISKEQKERKFIPKEKSIIETQRTERLKPSQSIIEYEKQKQRRKKK